MPRMNQQEGQWIQKCCCSLKNIHCCWLELVPVKSKLFQGDLQAVSVTFCVKADTEGDGLLVWISFIGCEEYDWCSNQCFYCCYIASVLWAVQLIKCVTKNQQNVFHIISLPFLFPETKTGKHQSKHGKKVNYGLYGRPVLAEKIGFCSLTKFP